MDLSWCIICDRHCVEENLYCSESCRMQDVNENHKVIPQHSTNPSPPSSPLLDPFFSSFHHDRRTSVTISRSTNHRTSEIFGYMSPSSVPRYSLSD